MSGSLESNMGKDVIETEAVVDEAYPNASFNVILSTGHKILAHLSGKMRKNFIKVMPGDKVIVEVTPYDLTKGRITRRLKV